ncbi:MAG: ABC transporter permease [Clostridia bacterium]|nr:ABC transporter permease [Clostridia bacterium]
MFKTLLSVNIRWMISSFFPKNTRKKPKSRASKIFTAVLIGLLAVYVAASLFASSGMIFLSLASAFCGGELSWLYFATVCIMVFLFSFSGSVFTAQNIIFNARDNDLLLSMPVPLSKVIASRVSLLMILNMFYAFLICLPAGAAYFFFRGFSLSVLLLLLAAMAVTVVLSSAVSVFFGWGLALISSRIRNRNLFQTIFSLIFFAAFILLFTGMQRHLNNLVSNGDLIAENVRKYLTVFYLMGKACNGDGILYLLAAAVTAAVPFALACLLISKSFLKITTAGRTVKAKKYVAKELKIGSAKTAMLKKEFARFFSLPLYILNCATGGIIALILGAFIFIKGSDFVDMFALSPMADAEKLIPIIIVTVLSFCSGMSNSAAASISLEGSRIDILRSMPVRPSDFFFAKYITNFIIAAVPTAVSLVLVAAGLKFAAETFVAAALACTAFTALSSFINMFANTLLPRFSWNSEAVIIKQSASVLAAMLAVMAACATLYAPYFPLAEKVSPTAYFCCTAAVCAAGCAAFALYYKTKGKEKFAEMHS